MNYSICKECNTPCDENLFCFNPGCIRNIQNKLKLYSEQIIESNILFESIIKNIIPLIKYFNNTIFMTGIGKSSHITKKCVATWQSLGIKAHNLLIQDLFHGDIGIVKDGDIIFYISNSGNTDEILTVAKYIKTHFKITQFCFSNNPSAKLNEYMDYSYNICNFKIKEIDILNIVPSVSTSLFMMLLDNIGVHLAEMRGFNKTIFKLNHPGGEIGKRV